MNTLMNLPFMQAKLKSLQLSAASGQGLKDLKKKVSQASMDHPKKNLQSQDSLAEGKNPQKQDGSAKKINLQNRVGPAEDSMKKNFAEVDSMRTDFAKVDSAKENLMEEALTEDVSPQTESEAPAADGGSASDNTDSWGCSPLFLGQEGKPDVPQLRQMILWSEVLGEPVSRKNRRKRMERGYGNQGYAGGR